MTEHVAVVTGAGRGLGEAIARRLHAQGCRVALADVDPSSAAAVAAQLDPGGRTAVAVTTDVRAPDQIESCVATVTERWSAPDILVNNAARTAPASLWDIGIDEWDDVLTTNLRSVFLFSRACAATMRQRGWGRIVNLASIAGQAPLAATGAHYAASKAGIVALTKVFAQELAESGVTVNAVAPGAIRTPVMDGMPADQLAAAEATIPLGRFGSAEEVAALVAHLCSADAGYLTGATIDVNGGILMR
ncbi:SDR family oxidoreductase [Amycolatopsis jejuensis]|uniref:SDR family oxidoreductase n=1 Tax=Amycolatopsis jejuensis TaxID=330084 RepID=UPI000526D603|nr:SDR family NAD(P)-dependent oxidoreductase [Amycolatopsis jejuensis]